jgi:salicylate hydroxylase
MPSWSNKNKTVVMVGDAVHAMQNHMAQGAGTAIEDGAFLGQAISEVVRGVITVPEAVALFEQRRMPKAWIKQQLSFHSGSMYSLTSPEDRQGRNRAGRYEVARWEHNPARHESMSHVEYRSWIVSRCAETVKSLWYYDAEADADNAVLEYLMNKGHVDDFTQMSDNLSRKWRSIASGNGVDGTWAEPELDYQHMKSTLYKPNGTSRDGIREYGLREEDYSRFGKGL